GGLVGDLEGVLARRLAGTTTVRELGSAPGIEPNTDDRNQLEYAFARAVGSGSASLTLLLRQLGMARNDRAAVTGDVDWARVVELGFRGWLPSSGAPTDVPPLPQPNEAAAGRSRAT